MPRAPGVVRAALCGMGDPRAMNLFLSYAAPDRPLAAALHRALIDDGHDMLRGPASGENRVIRGGGRFESAAQQRASLRWFGNPELRTDTIGFRCAQELR